MCTVTFLRTPKGFALTSSRDESPLRETLAPANYLHNEQTICYPKDTLGGGTWIAHNAAQKRVACLLNGAFVKHRHTPPYSRSRGQIVLESFDYKTVDSFIENVVLANISSEKIGEKIGEKSSKTVEPFTLVLVDYNEKLSLTTFRWDGVQKHICNEDVDSPHIWSSATLYDTTAKTQRATWFKNWLKNKENTAAHLLEFHQTKHGNDPENDILMCRLPGPRTVSITQIAVEEENVFFEYLSL